MIDTKAFWNEQAATYAQTWEPPGRHTMAAHELDFVTRHAKRTDEQSVLDIGIGTGRLLDHYVRTTEAREIFGADIAAEMVASCRERFAGETRIRGLVVADASSGIPFARRFDVVSAVRVLKYSERWADAVRNMADRLTPFGIAIFSMPNRNSINRFSRSYGVPWHTTTVGEIRKVCKEAGLEVCEIAGFTRLPYSLYEKTTSSVVNALTLRAEAAAGRVLGPRALSRELFVAARRV